MTQQSKLDFFHDSRQTFGRSSLVLQDGTYYGLFHVGVIKTLYNERLLPKIITGHGSGARIAALVCILSPENLCEFLKHDEKYITTLNSNLDEMVKNKMMLNSCSDNSSIVSKLKPIVEMTFEEAYHKSGRILNIILEYSGREDTKKPLLLNFLTSPNVLIWSAARICDSLEDDSEILCKDENGQVVPWTPQIASLSVLSCRHMEKNMPFNRISELFNCNHFIVSKGRFDIDMLITLPIRQGSQNSMITKAVELCGSEIKHRMGQLDYLGLLPSFFRDFLTDDPIPGFTVNIAPTFYLEDMKKLVGSNRDAFWIRKGEQSTWKMISIIRSKCAIELELEKCKFFFFFFFFFFWSLQTD